MPFIDIRHSYDTEDNSFYQYYRYASNPDSALLNIDKDKSYLDEVNVSMLLDQDQKDIQEQTLSFKSPMKQERKFKKKDW